MIAASLTAEYATGWKCAFPLVAWTCLNCVGARGSRHVQNRTTWPVDDLGKQREERGYSVSVGTPWVSVGQKNIAFSPRKTCPNHGDQGVETSRPKILVVRRLSFSHHVSEAILPWWRGCLPSSLKIIHAHAIYTHDWVTYSTKQHEK